MTDWHLQDDESGDVMLVMGKTDFFNLGKREDVLTRFADFFGDEHVDAAPEGFVRPPIEG